MKAPEKKSGLRFWFLFSFVILLCTVFILSCKRSGDSSGFDLLGPVDETTEAAKIVADANEDLTKIKVLYKENEGKREELKKAMEANDAEKAKKIADDVVYLINDGMAFGESAVDKIQKAQEMQINDDYREYLRLKEDALKRQLEAFENYRQAARTLRNNYDPKNTAMRDKVKEEFKTRNENYRKIMEEARDFSNRANDLAKAALKKQPN